MTSRTRAAGVASEFVIEPGQGDSVALGRLGVVFKLDGHISGGAFAVVEHPMAPGALVPPHTHEHEDEYSYVLAGTIGARIGDQDCEIGAGSYLLKPRGISHAFWNAGPAPAHVLEII
jgi:quercetin dioxygenase-like cupin family protein